MHKRLVSILALTILVASTLVGCSGAPSDSSTLTIFSITKGDVFVMKAGTDDWREAAVEMTLGVGDIIKTGDDSGAEITFFDGSTIELEAGTQIEITSLDSSPDSSTKTITLMQTVGTTISRVTKLLDPASTYAIETPSGVAAVRGSTMIVRIVFNDPNYPDGTVLIMSLEGDIHYIGQGEELQLAEGTQVIATSEATEIVQLSLAVDDSAVTDAHTQATVAAPGVLANDSGLIVGDTLAVIAVDTSGTIGNVTAWDADGSFTYDPNGQFEYLRTGNSTSDSFTYTVTDDYGITDTATVTIIINGVYEPPDNEPTGNEPPVYYPPVNHPPAAVADAAATDEDSWVSFAAPGVLENDSDPDGDILAVAAVNTGGTLGALNWSTDGSFTYDPNGQFEYLSAGNSTTDSFTYTVSDGHGGTDTATVAIVINGANDAPVAVDDSSTTPQDTLVTIDVLNNDSDTDGDALTVGSVTQGANGTVTNNSSYVTYTPNSGFTGTDSFTYTISDGNGGTDTATVTVTVTGTATIIKINVTIDNGPDASIYIKDDAGNWAIDEDTGDPVDGSHHVTSGKTHNIGLAGGHSYRVWVGTAEVTYYVNSLPDGWAKCSPDGGGEAACGYAAAGTYSIHFTDEPPL